jgi:hypothetical protein
MKRSTQTLVALLFVSLLGSFVQAQTVPWNTNIVNLVPPTTCSTGEPITACPILEYIYERAPSPNSTYVEIGRSTATSFTHSNVAAGNNCYRAKVVATTGTSVPSNVACKTNTAPVGPPNPPVISIAVVAGDVRTPIFSVAGTAPNYTVGTYFGSLPVGSPCGDYLFTYRKAKFHRVVPPQSALWGRTDVRGLAAPCA